MRFALLILTALLCGAALAEEWKAVEQPDLAERVHNAPTIETENLVTPVNSTRQDALMMCPNPDGTTWDVIVHYAPQYGGPNSFRVCDMGTGEVTEIEVPRYNHYHIPRTVVAPDGKLYISGLGRPHIRVQMNTYDPATNTLDVDSFDMPNDMRGETHPLVLGWDGMLYAMGAHADKSVTACRLNWKTGEVTFYGPMGPSHAPHGSWGYYGGVDDRYIYIASGKIPWYLVAYDREAGTSEVLLETESPGDHLAVRQHRYGCTAVAAKVKGTDGERREYWLYRGKAILKKDRREKPPWPTPEDGGVPQVPMPPRPDISLARAEAGPEGKAETWVRTQEARNKAKGLPEDASIEEQGWQVFKYTVPVYPQALFRLAELPDGRLIGTGGAYLGSFIYDPKTGESAHGGPIHLSHYATTVADGRIYMSGYPTSPLYEWDPDAEWTAQKPLPNGRELRENSPESNPRKVALLGRKEYAGTHKMYAAVTGADGQVYFGGKWIRDGAAGGLAWYNPETGEATGMWKPFSNYQITHMTTVNGGAVVVISTRRVSDPLLKKPTPDQGRLFLFDVAKKELVAHCDPVANATGSGPVSGIGTRVLGWTENPADPKTSILYAYEAKGNTVVWTKPLPFPLPIRIGSNQKEHFDFRLGPDGKVWTYMGPHVLVTIDPADGRIEPVGKVDKGSAIAFSGGNVYVAGTPAVRKLNGVRTGH